MSGYDSTAETLAHIMRVRDRLDSFAAALLERGRVHDASKLGPEEKPAFDAVLPLARGVAYGSAEYAALLVRMGPALAHHYAANTHHPEHYGADGVAGMDLFDLVEMVCDWMAAAERNPADGVKLEHNVQLFGIEAQLARVIGNTLARWPGQAP